MPKMAAAGGVWLRFCGECENWRGCEPLERHGDAFLLACRCRPTASLPAATKALSTRHLRFCSTAPPHQRATVSAARRHAAIVARAPHAAAAVSCGAQTSRAPSHAAYRRLRKLRRRVRRLWRCIARVCARSSARNGAQVFYFGLHEVKFRSSSHTDLVRPQHTSLRPSLFFFSVSLFTCTTCTIPVNNQLVVAHDKNDREIFWCPFFVVAT